MSDVVLMHGRTPDGGGIQVLRAREGRVEAGELRLMREGVPISSGDVVALAPRSEHPLLYDVQVVCSVGSDGDDAKTKGHDGPARVVSNAYRKNWDNVFCSLPIDTPDTDKSMLN
ncbi:MAG: hypothetical protein FWD57_08405 [Polyangiaceae bacterium]|nr:hypothetical protein [Polyangiaceae bacterium]